MCTGVVNATTAQPRIYENTLEDAIKGGYSFDPISYTFIPYKSTMVLTDEVIKKGQSRESGNIWYTR
jgi:hypothetical protein